MPYVTYYRPHFPISHTFNQIFRTFFPVLLSYLKNVLCACESKEKALVSEVLSYVERAKKGDDDAFLWLVKHYQRMIYSFIYRITKNREDAEEVTQDTFVMVHKKLGTLKESERFQSWLYRIANNLALNKLKHSIVRGKGKTDSLDNEESFFKPESENPHPRQEAVYTEMQKLVLEVMEDIQVQHRTILTLRDMEGLDYESISEILQIPTGTVKSRINQARICFKEKWSKRYPDLIP